LTGKVITKNNNQALAVGDIAGAGHWLHLVYDATNGVWELINPATSVSAANFGISGNLNFSGTGNRITGDFSNATIASRVAFQTSTTNSQTAISVIPNGTSTTAQLQVFNNSDATNYSRGILQVTNAVVSIVSDLGGTGTYLPMTFYTGGNERMRVDTSGNLLVGTTTNTNSSKVVSTGVVESTSGGFRFPDGTTQTTSATSSAVSSVNGKTGVIQSVVLSGTAVASTSGTSITFTGIPSWAKRITIMLKGVGTSGTLIKLIQLGSGSTTTSGYLGSSSSIAGSVGSANYTTGFGIQSGAAADRIQGNWIFTLENSSTNTWVCSGNGGLSNTGQTIVTGGYVSLSGTLDRIIFTTVSPGTDTMAAGEINILYE
jgi:hypothetical protein